MVVKYNLDNLNTMFKKNDIIVLKPKIKLQMILT